MHGQIRLRLVLLQGGAVKSLQQLGDSKGSVIMVLVAVLWSLTSTFDKMGMAASPTVAAYLAVQRAMTGVPCILWLLFKDISAFGCVACSLPCIDRVKAQCPSSVCYNPHCADIAPRACASNCEEYTVAHYRWLMLVPEDLSFLKRQCVSLQDYLGPVSTDGWSGWLRTSHSPPVLVEPEIFVRKLRRCSKAHRYITFRPEWLAILRRAHKGQDVLHLYHAGWHALNRSGA
jgi:hypothetical protein